MDVEAAGCVDLDGIFEVEERVGDVEVVLEGEVVGLHTRLARTGVDVDAVRRRERHRPEQTARIGRDPRIEVVDLGAEIGEVEPTPVEVESDEPEGSSMHLFVDADVDAAHEAHVGVE